MRGGMFRGGWEAAMRDFGVLDDGRLEGEDAAVVSERWGVLGGRGGVGGLCEGELSEWGMKNGGSGWLAV